MYLSLSYFFERNLLVPYGVETPGDIYKLFIKIDKIIVKKYQETNFLSNMFTPHENMVFVRVSYAGQHVKN